MQSSTPSYWQLTIQDANECKQYIQRLINEGAKSFCLFDQFDIPPDVLNDEELLAKLNDSFCDLVETLLIKSKQRSSRNARFPSRIRIINDANEF
jgi:hypothetical protein